MESRRSRFSKKWATIDGSLGRREFFTANRIHIFSWNYCLAAKLPDCSFFAFFSHQFKFGCLQCKLSCSEKKSENDDESQGISKSNTEASICSSKDHRIKALVKQIKFVQNFVTSIQFFRFRQLTYLSEKLIKEIEEDDDDDEIDASPLVDSVANEIGSDKILIFYIKFKLSNLVISTKKLEATGTTSFKLRSEQVLKVKLNVTA